MIDLDAIRAGKNGCPSDLTIDRFVAAELEPAVAMAIEEHTQTCEMCGPRLAERRAGFASFAAVDAARLTAKVIERQRVSLRARRNRMVAYFAGPFAFAATLLLFLGTKPHAPSAPLEGPEKTRVKGGGAVLHVFHQNGDRAEEVVSGTPLAAGDRLRFVVDLPTPGHDAIVGIEASGTLYPAWPLHGESTALPAGTGQVLPGAVSLDGSKSREVLYLAHCPDARDTPTCASAGAGKPPACPTGCSLSAFVLEKR